MQPGLIDVEADNQAIYALTGFDPAAPPGIGALVREIFDANDVVLSPQRVVGGVVLLSSPKGYGLIVDDKLTGADLALPLARAVANWYYRFVRKVGAGPVDALAYALMLPAAAAAIATDICEYSPDEIATMLRIPFEVAAARVRAVMCTHGSGEYARPYLVQTNGFAAR